MINNYIFRGKKLAILKLIIIIRSLSSKINYWSNVSNYYEPSSIDINFYEANIDLVYAIYGFI